MAKKQSLIGVVYAGINRLPADSLPPKKTKLTFYSSAGKITQRNALINQMAVAVSAHFQKAGYDSCILKGPGNAQMYPNPAARTTGDIDIWLDGDIKQIVKLARQKLPHTKACYHHVDFGKYKGVEIEIHYRPAYINNLICNGRMQRWFRQMAHEQMTHRITLQPSTDIGLRQLLDYYYLLMQGFSEEEKMNDERLLKRFGLYPVAAAVMYVLREIFGLPENKMLVPADERRGKFLLEEIMLAGNFGKYDKRLEGKRSAFDKNVSRLKRDIRFLRYFPSECLWEPVFRIYHFFWRASH